MVTSIQGYVVVDICFIVQEERANLAESYYESNESKVSEDKSYLD